MGGGSGGQAGFQDRQKGFDKSLKSNVKNLTSFAVKPIDSSKGTGTETGGGSRSRFSNEQLDALVEGVKITTQGGQAELEVAVSDSLFPGLKVRATRRAEGIVITFICPDRATKNAFVIERTKVYDRLRQRGIAIYRIDVV
jgi:hypothetical protein